MRYIALDTETAPIAPRATVATKGPSGAVNTSPYVIPALAVGSWAEGGQSEVEGGEEMCLTVQNLVGQSDVHLVFHNAAFDVAVLSTADPSLREPLYRAAEEGRIHDTMILDSLIRLAQGKFDLPRFDRASRTWAVPRLQSRGLDEVALDWCGTRLSKDPAIRLSYGQYVGKPVSALPESARAYALQDAVATLTVFEVMRARIEREGWKYMLSEPIQVRNSILCAEMDRRGIAVDRAEAARLRNRFMGDMAPLETRLVEFELGRWLPTGRPRRERVPLPDPLAFAPDRWVRTPSEVWRYRIYKNHAVRLSAPARFALDTRALRRLVGALAPDMPLTPSGLIGLDDELLAESEAAENPRIAAYLEYSKLRKVLTTYLSLYSQVDEVYPRWHPLGARSGRMSASRPSVQNVSKRRYGIRSLFVSRPGHVLVKGDFSWQELVTLAEVMKTTHGIEGPLADAIRAGGDIHRQVAARVFRKRPEDVTPAERQGAKAVDFGVPGGLGPKKLARYARAYGCAWSPEEARARRDDFLAAFPDIADYLSRFKVGQDAALRHVSGRGNGEWSAYLGLRSTEWRVIDALKRSDNPEIRAVGEAADHCQRVELPTGRVRAYCRFTEAANTGFQGLASDVTKEASWRAERAGLEVILLCHDEIVVQSRAEDWHAAADRLILERAMLSAFAIVCPHFGPFAKVEISVGRCWGAATDSTGKEIS